MSDTNTSPLYTNSVLPWIADVMKSHPKREALCQNHQSLTYKELDQKANGFAARFLASGVEAGGAVAICLNRSFDGIAAALGAMRVGAAYVPLDPAWPDSRLRYALADSEAKVLVAYSALASRIGKGIVFIDPARDSEMLDITEPPILDPPDPASVAYLIYTSGSTGTPKGVEITHTNLAHLAQWHVETFEMRETDRASHVAGLGFDAAVWEIWPNLCAGATVVLIDDESRRSPHHLQEWTLRERITVGFVPTVHAASMIQMQWPQSTSLRVLLTGGDVLQHGPAADLPFTVFNNYGPTECTVVSTSGLIAAASDGTPSIGRAIDGALLYLLDENGIPAPDSTAGEIFIGGNGVGRGYRNLDEITTQRFLPDPFAATPGARMFRTGDRALRMPNGELQFLGRQDRLVKIRGQRLELDEIGLLLGQHPAVDFSTATATSSASREKQLVGYVLLRKDSERVTSKDLKVHLRQNLPEYMVPSTFVFLDEVPLSPSGKIDYDRLPQPEIEELSQTASTVHAKLLTLLHRLLESDALDEDENFFLAGGDSLLGMQLVLRIQTEFGVNIGLQELFEAPTVSELSPLIERMQYENRLTSIWKETLRLETVEADEDFFQIGGTEEHAASVRDRVAIELGQELSAEDFSNHPTIRRQSEAATGVVKTAPSFPLGILPLKTEGDRTKIFWVHYLNPHLAKAIGDEWPFFSVTLTTADLSVLGAAPSVKRVSAFMVEKIRSTQESGPYVLGGLCLGAVLAWEIASQLRASGEEVRLLVLVDPLVSLKEANQIRLSHPFARLHYFLKRAKWLGVRRTLSYLLERIIKLLPKKIWEPLGLYPMPVGQDMLEAAAKGYQFHPYDRRVLQLLASEQLRLKTTRACPKVTESDLLHNEYIESYHRELMEPESATQIARIIESHLSATESVKSTSTDPRQQIRLTAALEAGI